MINEWNAFPEDWWLIWRRDLKVGVYNKRSSQFQMLGVITGEGTSTGGGEASASLTLEPEAANYSFCKTAWFLLSIYTDVHFVNVVFLQKKYSLKAVLDGAISALLQDYYLYEMYVLIPGRSRLYSNRLRDQVCSLCQIIQ